MKSMVHFIAIVLLIANGLSSCQQEIVFPSGNQPPFAKAGIDQVIILPVDSVSLDGSASADMDGFITSFKWVFVSGPSSFSFTSMSTAKTVVTGLTEGTYQFELQVTDNNSLSTKDTVLVTVKPIAPINHPPVANAGDDPTITLPAHTIVLSGTSSYDPDNNITSYTWTKIAGPASYTIGNPSNALTLATNLTEGIYLFELKVTDSGGLSGRDTLRATVLR